DVLIGIHEKGEWNKHLNTYGLDDTYINSGVLVMNLKALRDEKLDDAMIYLLNNNRYAFPDQDVINLICRNRINYVSNVYNSSETTGIVDNAKIIHYIRGNKGWLKSSLRSEIWYKYFYELYGGKIMEKYKVIVTRKFDDYEGRQIGNGDFKTRKVGDLFECTKERYEYLKLHGVVNLVEIVPEPIKEEPKKIVENDEIKVEDKKVSKKKK
nr:hypothetical protein [Elusimicrobiaceae bacterium]